MRPYPDELLRSMLDSLRNVIIPNLPDDWARYTAKGMEKLILSLELRYHHELEFLAIDTQELHELLGDLRASLASGPLAGDAALEEAASALAERLDKAPVPAPAVDVVAINQTNEAYRETLATVIESLDRAADQAQLEKEIEPLRDKIRVHLRRELDRDIELSRPTFMLFGAQPATAARG
jgi:hypothetical protein